jgi:hypothetical protein
MLLRSIGKFIRPPLLSIPNGPVLFVMKSFEAKVTGIVKLPRYRIKAKLGDRSQEIFVTLWRMSVSYLANEQVYEMELQQPLKQLACTEYSVGSIGLAEFDLSASPPVKIGDRIRIDAFAPGERIRDHRDE